MAFDRAFESSRVQPPDESATMIGKPISRYRTPDKPGAGTTDSSCITDPEVISAVGP